MSELTFGTLVWVVEKKHIFHGQEGIVIGNDGTSNMNIVVAMLDNTLTGLHNCEGFLENEDGYFFNEEDLEVLENEDDEYEYEEIDAVDLGKRVVAINREQDEYGMIGVVFENDGDSEDNFPWKVEFDNGDIGLFNEQDLLVINEDCERIIESEGIDALIEYIEDCDCDTCVCDCGCECSEIKEEEVTTGEENDKIKYESASKMFKYQIGDIVKVVKSNLLMDNYYLGTEAKVVATGASKKYPYRLEDADILFTEDELQLVKMRYHVVQGGNFKSIISDPAVIFFVYAYGKEFKGVAKCDKKVDIFDPQKGMEIAMRRASIKLMNYELKKLTR